MKTITATLKIREDTEGTMDGANMLQEIMNDGVVLYSATLAPRDHVGRTTILVVQHGADKVTDDHPDEVVARLVLLVTRLLRRTDTLDSVLAAHMLGLDSMAARDQGGPVHGN